MTAAKSGRIGIIGGGLGGLAAACTLAARGYAVTLDPDFAANVEEIVRNRQPWNPPSWD